MQGLQSIFGEQATAITLVIIVLGLALALVLLFWVFRKIATGNALRASRNRQPRLSVTDAAIVDDKRRLVLVRRDTVEHLVMIGGPTDIVVEQNIMQARPASTITALERTAEPPAAEPEPAAAAAAAAAALAAANAQAQSRPETAEVSDAAALSEPRDDGTATASAASQEAAVPDSIELDLNELAQELNAPETAQGTVTSDEPVIADADSLQSDLARELEADAGVSDVTADSIMEDTLAGMEEALAGEMPAAPATESPAEPPQGPQVTVTPDAPASKGKNSKTEVERLLDELSRA